MPDNAVRFGSFAFDRVTRELTRDGVPVKIQAQPAAVLALLLEKPGEIVSREEIRAAVWGEEVHVDFERSLNVCISQVRAALGDSSEAALYIRTHPRAGYSFIAPLAQPARPAGHRREWIRGGAALAAVTAVTAGLWRWMPRRIRIAVARFDNETGIEAFDRFAGQLADSVVAEMTEADDGRWDVIGNAAILRVPRAQRDIHKIGVELEAKYVILCQIQLAEPGYRLLAHLIRLPEQSHVKVTRFEFRDGDFTRAPEEGARRISMEFAAQLADLHQPVKR